MPNPKLVTYKNKATGTVYDYTDAAAQAALADILDGTDIDSFSDVETALATKVDKVTGKGLSTNDYDDTEKAKVAGAFPRSEQAVLGARQLITPPLYETSRSIYTAGINSNGLLECVFNGTVTEYTEAQLKNRTSLPLSLPKGRYRIMGGYSLNLYLRVGHTKNGEWELLATSYGDETPQGEDVFTLNEKDNNIGIFYAAQPNITYDNVKLYPMIVLADDPITEPTPPTMTNEELTENVTPIHTEATASTGTGSGDVSLNEANYKSIVKVGKVVFFNVRFTLNTATGTGEIRLVNLKYPPDASYPLITLRKRQAPYEEVCGLYINLSGEVTSYGIELPADDYWISGTYICK